MQLMQHAGLAVLKSPNPQGPADIEKWEDLISFLGSSSCLVLAEAEDQLENDDHEEPACRA